MKRLDRTVLAMVLVTLCGVAPAPAVTRLVPTHYPTIQQAISASASGDTVLVYPGTYVENLLITRDVVVTSLGGPAVTVIDGGSPAAPDSGSVVRMSAGTIRGFDLRNGTGTVSYQSGLKVGGGIMVTYMDQPPDVEIRDNWIHANRITAPRGQGAGIFADYGRADIIDNRIFDNRIESVETGSGGGLSLSRRITTAPYRVEDNDIFDNHVLLGSAAGVISADGIRNNVIACNSVATCDEGGCSALYLNGETTVEGNTVVANWSGNACAAVKLFVRYPDNMVVRSNNVCFNIGAGVLCSAYYNHPGTFDFECNNVNGNSDGQIVGDCADVIGSDGNISVDPLFGRGGLPCQASDWCLDPDSPLLPEHSPPGCGLIGALGECTPIAVAEAAPSGAGGLRALGARPNPFIGRTTITFYLPEPAAVEVLIYGVLGRRVRTLGGGWLGAGEHGLEWDGRGDGGERAASGAYVAVIRAGEREVTRALLLVR